METNEFLRDEIFSVVENQMRDIDPPETKETYNRLIKQGYNDFEARQLIGQCVAVEIFDIMNSQKPYK